MADGTPSPQPPAAGGDPETQNQDGDDSASWYYELDNAAADDDDDDPDYQDDPDEEDDFQGMSFKSLSCSCPSTHICADAEEGVRFEVVIENSADDDGEEHLDEAEDEDDDDDGIEQPFTAALRGEFFWVKQINPLALLALAAACYCC